MVYWLVFLPSEHKVGGLSPVRVLVPATTRSKSCASNTLWNKTGNAVIIVNIPCPMIALRGQPAGSRVPMVLYYRRCVVLGSGPA